MLKVAILVIFESVLFKVVSNVIVSIFEIYLNIF